MSQNKTITVLGKTFSSEEERREYFREELRQKLPELKKMEGFPIGEDDDIIALSDPPYYTACPNPWLNDFVAEWEAEKKKLEKAGIRKADFEVTEPFAADISEGKYDPVYRFHPFPTKVPHIAIMKYLLHYTQPGDLILDGFAGTGMTGVAAQLCGKPSPKFKYQTEIQNKKITWGKRFAILSDLSPLAGLISSNYNFPYFDKKTEEEAEIIIASLEKDLGYLYETKDTNGDISRINYTVWSDVFNCFHCLNEIVFWEDAVDKENGKVKDKFPCPHCQTINEKRNIERITESTFDPIVKEVYSKPKLVPVLINYTSKVKRYTKKPDSEDLEKLNQINISEPQFWVPSLDYMYKGVNWGDTWRKGVHNGINKVHHFYFRRTLELLSGLNERVRNSKNQILLTKIAFQLTKLYRFTYQGGTWGAGGGPLSGTLYIPSLIKELNPINSLKSALKARKKLKVTESYGYSLVGVQSTTVLSNLADNCIDYIFTDPPFGSNLMYSELNFISEAWLKVFSSNKNEAVENKSQGKGKLEYQQIMTDCFGEYFRVLKPGKWMTVEFSNTSAAIWNGIQTSIQNAGFIVSNVSALDKQKKSFKAVNTPTAVNQDLVISCYKPSSEFDQKFQQSQHSEVGVWDFVAEHLQHLPVHLVKDNSTTAIIERSPKILYDRLIAFYVQRSLPVPIDARKFQEGLRERFIERDGMFFTNEQVQEYDRKKAEVPNFVQLSLLVSSEQDGVLWLRDLLKQGPLTYQQLHPKWMTALGGVRKGDLIPELADILEENFLKNDDGEWYLPDPENEADLEKLRTNRLLKEFKSLLQEISSSKKKIKEVRVEAVRAGFKQCYQDKDFQTIVQVGDRIPGKILMEDEVLLQFYDIASSKV